jgi:hypothetical protein
MASLDTVTFKTEDGATSDRLKVTVNGKLSLIAKIPVDEVKTKMLGKRKGEALIFAETMQGLTPRDKDRLAAFLVRNQAKEWRMSVIEKVLRGERA